MINIKTGELQKKIDNSKKEIKGKLMRFKT